MNPFHDVNGDPNIVRMPQAILENPARERLENRLRSHVLEMRSVGKPLSESSVRRLAWHPELAAQLLRSELATRREAECLLRDPTSACTILLEDYAALCTLIEPRLLDHPPSLGRILCDQRRAARSGLHTETEYLRLLDGDPDRRFRMAPVVERPAILARLREESEMRWSESAPFAYFYFATHERIGLNPKLAEVLKTDEEYLYLALRVACGRKRPTEEIALLAEFRTSAWAFHVLRDQLFPAAEEVLLTVLCSHPAWLAEWWEVSNWERDRIESSYLRTSAACADHELLPEFYWCYRSRLAQASAKA